jgi:SAM-dependent methyltransferase
MSKATSFIDLAWYAIRRPKMIRNTLAVTEEYTDTWNAFRDKLERSSTVAEWLNDNDGIERYYNIDGRYSKQVFDSADFYRKTMLDGFERNYRGAKSVAEFGCGVGRNLIYLHLAHPELKLYGFELCKPGVELGNAAAKKFNLPITYTQLDYLNWIPADIKMPDIDVAFTIFSLEQIPDKNDIALQNIMSKVNMGTFHLEPVVENYPWTIRGMISKIDHYKVGYLKNFDKNARMVAGNSNVTKEIYGTAHNPLMYPSLYVCRKRDT